MIMSVKGCLKFCVEMGGMHVRTGACGGQKRVVYPLALQEVMSCWMLLKAKLRSSARAVCTLNCRAIA